MTNKTKERLVMKTTKYFVSIVETEGELEYYSKWTWNGIGDDETILQNLWVDLPIKEDKWGLKFVETGDYGRICYVDDYNKVTDEEYEVLNTYLSSIDYDPELKPYKED